jgi:ribose 5-phosphate isomerase RpiB
MRIVIGSDHAGFPLKATIIDHIRSLGHEVHDAGSCQRPSKRTESVLHVAGNADILKLIG